LSGFRGRLRTNLPVSWKLPTLACLLWIGLLPSPAAAANVAVLLSAKVAEYEEALRGFKEAAPHQIVATYDMDGDLERGRKYLAEIEAKVKPDLIFVVGGWALQVVVSRPPSIPVVYAMVLNPSSIIGSDGRNLTGASMNIPIEQPLRLFKQLGPQIKRIGVIYSRARTGGLVRRAQAVAREEGLELVTREIGTPKEVVTALESFQDGIDALWIVPDETVLSQAVVQQMLLFSYRRKVPVLGLSDRHAQMGALLALSFASGEDIGRQAGELAQSVLGGRPAAELPSTNARKLVLTVNLKAASKLGLAIPPAILTRATNVIQ
jgi:putative ABC transport system substrate-binding protein